MFPHNRLHLLNRQLLLPARCWLLLLLMGGQVVVGGGCAPVLLTKLAGCPCQNSRPASPGVIVIPQELLEPAKPDPLPAPTEKKPVVLATPAKLQVQKMPPLLPLQAVQIASSDELPDPATGAVTARSEAQQVLASTLPIRELTTQTSPSSTLPGGEQPLAMPEDVAAAIFDDQPEPSRGNGLPWPSHHYGTIASQIDFCYQPLLFEEINLERYGRSYGPIQPAVSFARFYSRVPMIPYMLVATRARTCTYHAHFTLPGYPARREREWGEFSTGGSLAEAAFLTGCLLVIP